MTTHTQPQPLPDSDSSAQGTVQAFLQVFADAWTTNDGAQLASFFTEDGSIVNPFGERADGSQAVAAMYTEYFGGLLQGTTTTIDHVSVRGIEANHAFVDGEQTISASSGEVVLTVHLAALLRRSGPSWRFADARPYTFPALPA
jgi:uncharacterized protein (TIGR02246 family)